MKPAPLSASFVLPGHLLEIADPRLVPCVAPDTSRVPKDNLGVLFVIRLPIAHTPDASNARVSWDYWDLRIY